MKLLNRCRVFVVPLLIVLFVAGSACPAFGFPVIIEGKTGVYEFDMNDLSGIALEVTAHVDGILAQIIRADMNSEQKVKAAYDFLLFQYVHEGEQPYDKSPKTDYNPKPLGAGEAAKINAGALPISVLEAYILLQSGQGVCDDFAALFGFMLNRLGIPCEVWGGYYVNRDGSMNGHAWNRAFIDGAWYWFDTDVEGKVYRRGGSVLYYLYKKDDTYWKTNHADWILQTPAEDFQKFFNQSVPAAGLAAGSPAVAPPASQATSIDAPSAVFTPGIAGLTALPTSSPVFINGAQISFDAYNIDGNNYFKLRDIAYALNGTEKQFSIEWDGAANTIMLTTDRPYKAEGSEMGGKGAGAKTAKPATANISLNGRLLDITAYNIEGNNYFKLRDIGIAAGFEVTWDAAANSIRVDTK